MADPDELILKCYKDPAAFRALVELFQMRLYSFLIHMAGRQAADDLFQEVWLRVLQAAGRYEPRGKAASWLLRSPITRLCGTWGAAAGRLLEAVVNPGGSSGSSGGEEGGAMSGGGMPGWLSFILVSGVATAGLYVAQRVLEPETERILPAASPSRESSRSRLEMPAPREETIASRGTPSGSMDLASLPVEAAGPEMPGRPLDCGSGRAILDFKRFGNHEFQSFPGRGGTLGARWSACLCGEDAAGRAGVPPPPPKMSRARKLPGILRLDPPLTPEDRERLLEHHVKVAKYVYEDLPLSQVQAGKGRGGGR